MTTHIIIHEVSLEKALQFVPAGWELFGVTTAPYYSYSPLTANYIHTGWIISPVA